ncbi:MAG: hypothetical protein ACREU7_03780, partial [Burkholderiales bacterium]
MTIPNQSKNFVIVSLLLLALAACGRSEPAAAPVAAHAEAGHDEAGKEEGHEEGGHVELTPE